jgi:hypothetical protein
VKFVLIWVLIWVWLCLAGCGRVGFDANPSADAMPDDGTVVIDGAFAGCTHDPFDGLGQWDNYGGELVAADGVLRVEMSGARDDANGVALYPARSYVGWTTIVQVVQSCMQPNTMTGIGWHDDTNSEGVHLSITQGEIRLDLGSVTAATDPYDPVDDRWLRLRESGGDLFGASSPDGVTWNEFGSIGLDARNVHTDLGADAPFLTVNADFALFDDYVECPP